MYHYTHDDLRCAVRFQQGGWVGFVQIDYTPIPLASGRDWATGDVQVLKCRKSDHMPRLEEWAVKIMVTADDIARGITGVVQRCPLALAIQRCSGMRDLCVGTDYVFSGTQPGKLITHLPPEAAAFRLHFDDGLPVQPITFEIEL